MTTRAMKSVSVSEFKANCLSLLENVRRTGRPLKVTRRGRPLSIVHPAESDGATWLGSMKGSVISEKEIVSPVGGDDWESAS